MNGGFSTASQWHDFQRFGLAAVRNTGTNPPTITVQPIKLGNIPDGASNTLLFGEKYVPVGIDTMVSDTGDLRARSTTTTPTRFASPTSTDPG